MSPGTPSHGLRESRLGHLRPLGSLAEVPRDPRARRHLQRQLAAPWQHGSECRAVAPHVDGAPQRRGRGSGGRQRVLGQLWVQVETPLTLVRRGVWGSGSCVTWELTKTLWRWLPPGATCSSRIDWLCVDHVAPLSRDS